MLPPIFASGSLFAHVFHGSPVAMSINALPDGRYVDVNDAFTRLLGYSREELIGQRAIDLGIVTPQRREPLIHDLLSAGSLGRASQSLCDRSGQTHEVLVSAQLEEHEGQLYTVAIIQDLTDYHRTQDALRASEARFRLFFDSVPLPVWVFDMETLRILDANPAACAVYGYTLDELRALTVLDIRPPSEQDAFRAHIAAIDRWPGANGVWRHLKKDGTPMDVAITGYTLELGGRRVRLSVLRDITHELAAERARVDSERRLQIITNLSTDGIWELNVATQELTVNEAFRQMFGAPEPDRPFADWWRRRVHADDVAAVLRSLEELARGGATWATEFRLLRRDDTRYATVLARGHVIRDRAGAVTRVIGALVDISRPMEVIEAATQAALEERQRLARDLHDSVTQSLYSITLLAEVARRFARVGDAAATQEQIIRLGELSQQCLREMRLLVYELRPAMVEESGLVGALRQRLEAVEQRSGVGVNLHADDDRAIPLAVQNELFRVAEEALNNALKHAHASRLTVELHTTAEEVTLAIADNGRGFDPDLARVSGGQGLGNMRERVARLGGRFQIDSALGRATTIHVRLPLRAPDRPLAYLANPV